MRIMQKILPISNDFGLRSPVIRKTKLPKRGIPLSSHASTLRFPRTKTTVGESVLGSLLVSSFLFYFHFSKSMFAFAVNQVSFQGKQRLMGEGAASIAKSNFKNTVREVKRLVGRTWGSPDLEADLKRLPFKCM